MLFSQQSLDIIAGRSMGVHDNHCLSLRCACGRDLVQVLGMLVSNLGQYIFLVVNSWQVELTQKMSIFSTKRAGYRVILSCQCGTEIQV